MLILYFEKEEKRNRLKALRHEEEGEYKFVRMHACLINFVEFFFFFLHIFVQERCVNQVPQ